MRLALRPIAPFDFPLTARVLRRFSGNPIDVVDDQGCWSRVVALGGRPVLLSGEQRGAQVLFATDGEADRAELRRIVDRLFGLDRDVRPFFARALRDRRFAEVARRCVGLRPQRFSTLFETFANAICCQQLSLAAGLTVLGRLARACGPRVGDRVGPPEPERIACAPDDTLRAAGLSRAKVRALKGLAAMPLDAFERELAPLDADEARRRLLALPGIGPWSADYVLLRGLGRLEIFPPGDVGAAKTLGQVLGRTLAPDEAPRAAARFAPFQGMVYFCMLGSKLALA